MRAVVFERCGEPADVLEVREVGEPHAQPGEVVVRMLASPVNPSDLMTIRGTYGKALPLPATPGYEGAGVVESANAGIYGRLLLGKRVSALTAGGGAWQERVAVPARQVIPVPTDWSVEQSAMFFVNPATAFILTRKILNVPAGGWLLQTAAGSAVGKMVIRLGRHFGFRTLNVVRRAEQAAELQDLGADAVVPFDPQRSTVAEFVARVRELVGAEGVPCAIDPVGGATASAVVPCLGRQGRMVLYGTLSPDPIAFSPRHLMTGGASISGFWLGNYMADQGLLGKLSLIRALTGLIKQGVLTADVAQIVPLAHVREAVAAAEQPGKGGKIVLRIAD